MRWVLTMILLLALLAATLACGTAKGRYDGDDLADDDDDDDDDDDGPVDDDDDDDGDDDYEKVDDFTWTDVEGNQIQLYDYEGQVVLLNVGAGWCSACKEETPSLQADLWETYRDEGFVLIQLLVEDAEYNPASQDDALAWRDEFDLTYTVCPDPDWSLKKYFLEETLPFNLLLDKQLRIREKTHMYDADVFSFLIEELL